MTFQLVGQASRRIGSSVSQTISDLSPQNPFQIDDPKREFLESDFYVPTVNVAHQFILLGSQSNMMSLSKLISGERRMIG